MDGNGDAILWLPFEGRLFCPIFQVQTFPVSLPEAKKFYIPKTDHLLNLKLGFSLPWKRRNQGVQPFVLGRSSRWVLWVQPLVIATSHDRFTPNGRVVGEPCLKWPGGTGKSRLVKYYSIWPDRFSKYMLEKPQKGDNRGHLLCDSWNCWAHILNFWFNHV